MTLVDLFNSKRLPESNKRTEASLAKGLIVGLVATDSVHELLVRDSHSITDRHDILTSTKCAVILDYKKKSIPLLAPTRQKN